MVRSGDVYCSSLLGRCAWRCFCVRPGFQVSETMRDFLLRRIRKHSKGRNLLQPYCGRYARQLITRASVSEPVTIRTKPRCVAGLRQMALD